MASKLKYSLCIVGLIVSLSSCKKDWLQVTSDTTITSNNQFKSEGGFKDALMGVYIGMGDRSLYSKDLAWNMVDVMGQQYATLASSSLYSSFQTYNYRSTVAQPLVEANWLKAYNVIANINNVLNNIDNNKDVLNVTDYAVIKGELLGLRAFIHLDLMRLYGYGNLANRADISTKLAVPYVTKFSKETTPQLSYEATADLLLKDINEAVQLLKEDPIYNNPTRPASYYNALNRTGFYNNREQRFNYYAALALKARALQWIGGAQNLTLAAEAAEEVILNAKAKLITASEVNSNDPLFYKEHLFNLNVTNLNSIMGSYLDANSLTNNSALYLTSDRAQEVFETSNTNIGVPDVRFNTLLSQLVRGYISVKYLEKTSTINKNIISLIKLPEMYYIAAESYKNTNPTKAIEYLNRVRKSRGILEDIPSGIIGQDIQDEIQKEYRKEFIMEGQLFYYYKRQGLTTFPGLGTSIVANDNVYLLPYPSDEIEFGNRVQ